MDDLCGERSCSSIIASRYTVLSHDLTSQDVCWMWFLRLPWVVTCLGLMLDQAGLCVARAQRPLSELDVTFFPGVTPEYEAALRYGELRRFLKEEQREVEREEVVLVRLLHEEHESQLDEPIEFATQKRLLKQLCDLKALSHHPGQTGGHATQSTSVHHEGHSESSDKVSDSVLYITESPVESNFYDLITPSDKLLFQPEKHRYTTHFVGGDKQTDGRLVSTGSQEKIHKLEEAFRHPKLGAIPDATITRLLDNKPKTPPSFHRAESDFLHHQYDSLHGNPRNRHQVTSDSRREEDGTLSLSPHHKSKNGNHQLRDDHKARHQALVYYLLENQELITPEDLSFILESEKFQQDDGDHTASQDDYQPGDHTTGGLKDEDWEEDYEYDV